ncbi:imidazole glycerol phosphate synthase cyclase subunit [Prochlorococcus sp. AH-736-E15]|nr:imidazole glycerol phosphate synthase cyclase subunit [Prochlorococcus sp. AH-736-E15]
MLKKRLVSCLLLRNGLIVQSIGFKKFLPIGKPKYAIEFASRWDVDEIILLDISSASKKELINLSTIEELSESCFVPLTIGGGISSLSDAKNILKSGADKICINSHALRNERLISQLADLFGTQCVVVSIDVNKDREGNYYVHSHNNEKIYELNPIKWAKKCEELGAGEIFLNAVHRDGSKKGYDTNLISLVSKEINIPLIVQGGIGHFNQFKDGIDAGASAVSASNIFQHIEHSTIIAKAHLYQSKVNIRLDSEANYFNRAFDEDGRLIMLDEDTLFNLAT